MPKFKQVKYCSNQCDKVSDFKYTFPNKDILGHLISLSGKFEWTTGRSIFPGGDILLFMAELYFVSL